jgi:hypothetical protein
VSAAEFAKSGDHKAAKSGMNSFAIIGKSSLESVRHANEQVSWAVSSSFSSSSTFAGFNG